MATTEKDRKTAKCKIPKCTHAEFFCGDGGSTSPLWCHLEVSHWAQYVTTEEYGKKKKKVQNEGGNIMEAFKMDSKNPSVKTLTSLDNTKLRDMFAAWIVKRQRLFNIIKDPELIEIIEFLNPTAKLVKGDAIKNTIMSLYSSGKRELKASFMIIYHIRVLWIKYIES
ncbi:15682_t:CDS:2 [Dentiscutata erythropus]|uniref:15682_t:CDS:1 n=1 Tax=Dentiscutata erythropus TaxID=1348616 RepID=A0A9N9HDM1_9GLOM|nr:15682_t:CDS:2 [Dentiscutata erythropus]